MGTPDKPNDNFKLAQVAWIVKGNLSVPTDCPDVQKPAEQSMAGFTMAVWPPVAIPLEFRTDPICQAYRASCRV